MFLSYFDDSGSDPSQDLCVFGGVVIPGDAFGHAESWCRLATEHVGIEVESFREFKAVELYFGTGQFEKCHKRKCREAFLLLLTSMSVQKFQFIYCAVDRRRLEQEKLMASAHPVDVAFRMCLDSLEGWAREQHDHPEMVMRVDYKDMCVVIADDCDPGLRKQLLKSFRSKRQKMIGKITGDRLWHIHDAMYFGDSADSVGLQMADVACWTMRRWLNKEHIDRRIVEYLLPVARCASGSEVMAQYPGLFKNHGDVLEAEQAELWALPKKEDAL